MTITGSPRSPACDGMPALMLASGPIVVPVADRDAPLAEDHGRRERDHRCPRRKCRELRARRWRGPIAPTRAIPSHAAWITSPATRPISSFNTREPYCHWLAQYIPAMANGVVPIRLGLLYDFPQGGSLFADALRLGLDEVAASGRLDREIEFVEDHAARAALRLRARHQARASPSSIRAGAIAIVGPSISDNALIAAPLCDAARLPAINYSGGERTRSQWMFHYQVGSLEEEPPLLAARMVERGLRSAAVVFDQSPVGRRYAECFEAARGPARPRGHRHREHLVVGRGRRRPARRASGRGEPDVLVYFGLGVVVARGRARPAGRSVGTFPCSRTRRSCSATRGPTGATATRAGSTSTRSPTTTGGAPSLKELSPHAAGGPIGCAAYDIGRLLGEAIAQSDHLTRAGIADGLRRAKQLPATSGYEGTLMGFGTMEHAALKGHYLVLREWRDGRSVQITRRTGWLSATAGQNTRFSLRAVRIAHEIVKRIPANVIASDAPVLIATKVWSGRRTSKPKSPPR